MLELRKAALTPSKSNASTWSCISAIQRRNHDARTRAQQRGNLVAQRFAAAGRHQHQRISTRNDMFDDRLLFAAIGGVTEHVMQYLVG